MTTLISSEHSLLTYELDSRYLLSDPPDLTRSIAAGRWKELNILLHSVALLGEDLDSRRSLSPLLRASVAIVSADKALLYQWDEAFSGLRISTALGFEEEPDAANSRNAQAHASLLNRKPVIVSSPAEAFLRDELAWTGCQSALTVPITHQGLPWGALQLLRERPFSRDDAILLWIYGLILEGVLPIHLGVKRLREMVGALDPATGLLTPAHFRRRLAWELQRSSWIARPLALACIEVNETLHGRPRAGGLPFTTRDAAQYAQKALRQHDSLTCLGGHQFLVAMPDTSPGDAGRVVDLIREAFLARAAGTLPSYAIASGLATYPENGLTGDEVIRAACAAARRATASRTPRADR